MRRGIRSACFISTLIGVSACSGDPPPAARVEAKSSAATPDPPPPARQPPPIRKDGTVFAESELMGTRISLNVFLGADVPAERAGDAAQAMEDALAEMARIERILSEWQPTSELSRLNAAAAEGMAGPSRVSPELFEVLERAAAVSKASRGAFDVTFHGVGQLWSFEPGSVPPTREAIRDKLPLVDHAQVELDPGARTVLLRTKGMKIGLGAIGKGYAVDRASAVLSNAGFPNHIVEAGGDTFVAGTKSGKPWVVGVQAPGRRGTVGALPMKDRAVVTSGDYQRFFEHEGKRYSHILDPRTGWPLAREDAARSVTLVASDATNADAYCTAVAVMGTKDGMAFVESRDDLDAVILTLDDQVLVSSGLRDVYLATPPRAAAPSAAPGSLPK